MRWYDLYNYINPNNLKGIEYSSIPNYSITNVPIMTYALLGITTFALGYITLKDGEKENGPGSESSPPESQKGGLLLKNENKQKNSKSKTTKKKRSK